MECALLESNFSRCDDVPYILDNQKSDCRGTVFSTKFWRFYAADGLQEYNKVL